jgi:hypothetical protein
MPDEMSMREDAEETSAIPPIVHDDIMQRLLDYQRQLREGLTAEQVAELKAFPIFVDHAALEPPAPITTQTETVEVIDLAAVEGATAEPIEVIEVVEVVEAEPAPAVAVPQVWANPTIASAPTPMPRAPAAATDASADLAARVAKLEDTLSSVAKSIGELREQFQNIALAADDRLGAIESTITGAKDDAANAS